MIQTRARGIQLTTRSFTTSHTRFEQGPKTGSDTVVHLDNEQRDPHFFSRILKQPIKGRANHGSGPMPHRCMVLSSCLKHAPPRPPRPNTTTPRPNDGAARPPFFFRQPSSPHPHRHNGTFLCGWLFLWDTLQPISFWPGTHEKMHVFFESKAE
jgi:hypothetical protein